MGKQSPPSPLVVGGCHASSYRPPISTVITMPNPAVTVYEAEYEVDIDGGIYQTCSSIRSYDCNSLIPIFHDDDEEGTKDDQIRDGDDDFNDYESYPSTCSTAKHANTVPGGQPTASCGGILHLSDYLEGYHNNMAVLCISIGKAASLATATVEGVGAAASDGYNGIGCVSAYQCSSHTTKELEEILARHGSEAREIGGRMARHGSEAAQRINEFNEKHKVVDTIIDRTVEQFDKTVGWVQQQQKDHIIVNGGRCSSSKRSQKYNNTVQVKQKNHIISDSTSGSMRKSQKYNNNNKELKNQNEKKSHSKIQQKLKYNKGKKQQNKKVRFAE